MSLRKQGSQRTKNDEAKQEMPVGANLVFAHTNASLAHLPTDMNCATLRPIRAGMNSRAR